MTADERIENLLNEFGQTISDLPKPQTADYAYTRFPLWKALTTAIEWHGRTNSGSLDTEDYICHLVDVIDRMELALERAIWERDTPPVGGDKEEMPKANYNERSESWYVNDWD